MRKEYLNNTRTYFDSLSFELPWLSDKGAVIVETRIIPDFGAIVKNHLYFLPEKWSLTVFHGETNSTYVREQLKDVINVKYVLLPHVNFNEQKYNLLLTDAWFWDNVPCEKVLIFQTDTLLLKRSIERYLEFDYVGAPWNHINLPGGNGGLSLRSKSKMLEVINNVKYNHSHENEDLYFCRNLHTVGGAIAPKNICQQFSVETIFFPDPFGVHAPEKYIQWDLQEMILQKAIQNFDNERNTTVSKRHG